MKNAYKLLGLLTVVLFSINSAAQTTFEKICKEKIAEASTTTIVGEDDWLFLPGELSHIAKGKFYGAEAAKTAVCTNAGRQDPIPAIVDFNNQLKKLGITLYLMPVPPKALINANKVDASVKMNQSLYVHYKNMYKQLASEGVDVINLFPEFTKATSNGNATYCKQDSHWNSKGIEIAAKILTSKIKNEQWYKTYAGTIKKEKPVKKTIQINGDLRGGIGNIKLTKEKITINTFSQSSAVDSDSPVLIIGDSHTLIFHAGDDMLAENAGLLENVAASLGVNLDLIGVKGSGTSSVRIDLYRKAKTQEWLNKKKVIIWCFAARDFSESKNGWRKIPVVK